MTFRQQRNCKGGHCAPAAIALLLCLALAGPCGPASAAEHFVASPSDIAIVMSAIAQPGDTLVMREGIWHDADILFSGNGTESAPITLRAEIPGEVVLTGTSRLRIAGNFLVVDGLKFAAGYVVSGDVIAFRNSSSSVANNCRVSNCAIIDYNPDDPEDDTKWVSLYGFSNRVDNCYFKGKKNVGGTVVVWVDAQPDKPNYHRIEANYFGPRTPLGLNGAETIRIGTSDVSLNLSRTTVERNYFEQCNGEAEVISSKSCENIFKHNTFVECEGALTLRHGNRCVVEGNYFFGNLKPQTGGVRIIGEDHQVFNNYFADLTGNGSRFALSISQGLTNSPLSGYFQVKRALVAFNTFANCQYSLVVGLASTLSGTTNVTTLPPVDCIIANNLVRASTNATKLVDQRIEPVNMLWQGNIMAGASLGIPANSGIREIDPILEFAPDGLWRPAPASPALGTAAGSFPSIIDDMEGQSRPSLKDVGCDQASVATAPHPPLTAFDVGPFWMQTRQTIVTWETPDDLPYGRPLTAAQLNANANTPGTFVYTPPLGTILNAGANQLLTVVFTPNDLVHYSTATQSVRINIPKATPAITWATPAPIVYGTVLSATQLNAMALIPGTFSYTPALGTLLNGGAGQLLSVLFIPADTTNYNNAPKSVALDVLQATPVITWANPANITNGTALSAVQLNATANVPGTFVYTPGTGAILNAGSGQPLSVTFTPNNPLNYRTVSKTVTINVTTGGKLVPTITWPTPGDILYGTPLSAVQLNATASDGATPLPGTFTYFPAAGTVLEPGNGQILSLTFVPANSSNYVAVTRSVTINVAAELINTFVRVAYILPTNRVAQVHAVEDLRHAILLYQDWFREQMTQNGFGPKTFRVETEADGVTPKIHVLQVRETDTVLRSDLWGQRVIEAATAAGIPLGTPGEIWWMVPETHIEDMDGSISGSFNVAHSYGGSGKDPGWAVLGSDYLARCGYLTDNAPYNGVIIPEIGPYPLLHEISFPWFDGSTLSSLSSSAVGAGLRGIAEALGLDHDFRNDENFNGNLMGFGFRGIRGVVYPKLYPFNYTRLSYGAALALNVSPYFNVGRALSDYIKPQLTVATSGASTPANGLLRITFSASDMGGLSAALLSWNKDSEPSLVGEMVLAGTNFVGTFTTPFHEEGQTNEYTISVYDLSGNKKSVMTAIFPLPTLNHAPLPSIKVTPSTAGPGEDVVFDASATFDAEHSLSLLEVEWDSDGDGFFEIFPATSLVFTNQYFERGSRLVRARVTDPAGASAVSAPVAVNIGLCPATLSPVSRTNGFGTSTNSITVTAGAKCIWNIVNTNDWIQFPDGMDFSGSATVRYSLSANPGLTQRIGTFLVADQIFTAVQRGIACDYVLSPVSRLHGFGVVTGTVKVTVKSECPWTVYNTNSWIRFLTPTNGFGTFTNTYVLEANRVPNERTGTVLIEDQVYTITQWGTNCTYLVSPSERVHGEGSLTGLVSVAANNNCSWVVDNQNSWITLTRSNGIASGSVGYTLTENFLPGSRTAVLTVAGQPVTIIQGGCTYQISATNQFHDYEAHDGEIGIVSGGGCPWTVVNPTDWIHLSAQSGNGGTTITYTIDANTRNLPRIGTLDIADQRLTIIQAGEPCFYEISTNRMQHDERGDIAEIFVRTDAECPWRVVNTNEWIQIRSGTNGMGSNSVVYSVTENLGPERTGNIFIEGMRVEVQQKRGLRLAQLTGVTVGSGQTNCLRVMLESHGTERSMRFSLCFDPTLITFASARPFTTSRGETLSVDTSQAAQGRVGFAFSLPSGRTLFAGTQTVAEVCFRGAAVVGNRTTGMNFCDQPTPREVLNVIGQPRPVVYSNATARIIGVCDLAESVDAPQFVWTTDSTAAWTCQTAVTHDQQDAAQCGITPEGSSSSMMANFTGPGTLTFWWKVSSEPSNDRLRLYHNGSEVSGYRISGEVDWEFRTFTVPSGVQELEWRYSKNSTLSAGLDCGWVDEIRFESSPPAITSQPVSQSVDAGATVTFNVTATGTPPLTYRWQVNGANLVDGGNISGTTTPTLRLSNVQPGNAGNYSVIISNANATLSSESATLAVTPTISLAEALDTTNLTWTTTGTPPWVGQAVVTQDNSDAARSGALSGSGSCSMQAQVTGPGIVTFSWKVSSFTNSNRLIFYTGSSGSTEMARISGEVEWQQRTFNVGNGTQILRWTYQRSSSTSNGQERAWVDQVQFTPMPPAISTHPASRNVDVGSTVSLSVVAAGSPPLTYQWQLINGGTPVNLVDGGAVRGATTSTLTISNAQVSHSGTYAVLVSNGAGSTLSSNATLIVSPVVSLAAALDMSGSWTTNEDAPYWSGQPLVSHDGVDAAGSGAIAEDEDTSVQVTVVGPGTVSFWWKVSCGDEDELRFYASGSERASIFGEVDWQWRSFPITSTGNQVLRWRYSRGGDPAVGQDRGWVDQVVYVPSSVPTAPLIQNPPASQSAVAQTTVTFNVGAIGSTPLGYQWQFNGMNMTNGGNVSGATTATLILTGVQSGQAGNYSVVVTNSVGSATSSNALLTVVTAPLITTHPVNQNAAVGSNITLTVRAIGLAPLTFQWRFNGATLANGSGVSGATTSNLTLTSIQSGRQGSYSVVVSNAAGGVLSSNAFLTVVIPPAITSQPQGRTVIAGTNITLTVTANGTLPLSYQWRFNGANLFGETGPSLSLANVQAAHAGAYSVIVSNTMGMAVSSNAVLTVLTPPLITAQPSPQNADESETVTFRVTATGTQPLTYRWRLNGSNLINGGAISGATTPTLTLVNVQPAHAGNYSVVVSNVAGVVISSSALLGVDANLTLGEAVDAPYLAWNTGLSAPWTPQTNVTSDAVDAARSGVVTNNQSTWLETIVNGPGILRFWWKASSETNRDWLIFYVNGVEQTRISGSVDWHQRGLDLPASSQTLQWVYAKDSSGSGGQDRVWLDQVEFIPTTGPTVPVILTQPESQGVLPGVTVTLQAEAAGTGPLNCQWYFNGNPMFDGDFVAGSTTARLTLTDVQAAQQGTYNLVVRNAYSVATSSNAVLTLMSPVSLAEAMDTPDWIWFNAGYAGWAGQTTTSYDRIDSAESAPLAHGQTNWMQTDVLGPGAVSFWWKVSSETNRDRLRFYVNGVEQANLSGEVDWRWRTFDVGAGNQVLRWAYTKDSSGTAGLDRGWIDQVLFGPSAPVITNKPSSQVVDIGTTVKFEVDAGGSPPLTYQWQFNGTNLTDGGNVFRSTKDRLIISNALPHQSGSYAVLVSNPGGKAISQTATLQVNPGLPLAEALNTPDWIYVPAAYSFWVGQTEVTHDGLMAARSGFLPNSETASMQTTVNGPGTLKFWWKVSSESNRDWLKFFVHSNEFVRISGEVDWQQRIYELPPGPQILRWDYSKDSINTNGQDRAWVDQIEFSQTPPTITNQPASQSVDANTTVTFNVGNIGTPPFTYQWRLNGTNLINSGNISGANSASLRITGVLLAQAGNYSVVISNVAGHAISANAVLTISPIVPLADALDMPGVTWSVSGSPPWVGQVLTSHDNVDAARSGAITHGTDTRMETTIVGPGTLTFWWKVSSQTNGDYLRFYLDGDLMESISGEVNWVKRTYSVPSGSSIDLEWRYAKNSSISSGQDRGWVDEVLFVGSPPGITTQPTNRVVEQGTTVSITAAANGSAPLFYRWHFNGVPMSNGTGVSGATNTTLILSNVQPAQSGNYFLRVTNTAGGTNSVSALVTVTPVVSLAEALDTAGPVWVTSQSSSSLPPWAGVGRPADNHDGEDAARSGTLSGSSVSCSMQITVTGPGTVSFWWKVSSNTNNNRLRFYTGSSGSTERTNISGEVGWRQETFNLGSGSQILKWTYQRNSSTSRGQERGWVDQVVFASSAPVVTPDPIVANIAVSGDKILLRWSTLPGKNYEVLYKDDLSESDWKMLPAEISISNSTATVEDDTTAQPRRFYQILEH